MLAYMVWNSGNNVIPADHRIHCRKCLSKLASLTLTLVKSLYSVKNSRDWHIIKEHWNFESRDLCSGTNSALRGA